MSKFLYIIFSTSTYLWLRSKREQLLNIVATSALEDVFWLDGNNVKNLINDANDKYKRSKLYNKYNYITSIKDHNYIINIKGYNSIWDINNGNDYADSVRR